jgi:murein DD-endopeptidase MepM/ murein hydrolase activator NlpD
MPAIIELNRLAPPYLLRVGEVLRLPVGKTYIVAPRDTLYGVSRELGLSMADVVRLNNLDPPYRLFPGQTLLLPAPVVTAAAGPRKTSASTTARPSTPASVVIAPVVTELVPTAPNRQTMPLPIPRPGTAVAASSSVLSSSSQPQQPTVVTAQPAPAPTVPATPEPAASGPVVVAASSPPITVSPAAATQAATTDPGAPPPARSGRFVWPVIGRVALGYGLGDSGLRNDGINIAAPRGSSVRVAENGIVVYADDGLRGLGNVVLVRHAEGWVTAYAHVDRMLVSPGASVRQGQAIATVGSSGSVASPQLHFQIRKNRDAVDPLSLLPAGA